MTRRLNLVNATNIVKKLLDLDADGELINDQFLRAKRKAFAQPNVTIRISDVIKQIIARNNVNRPNLPPPRMQSPLSPQRGGPSRLKNHKLPFLRHVNSSCEQNAKLCSVATTTFTPGIRKTITIQSTMKRNRHDNVTK